MQLVDIGVNLTNRSLLGDLEGVMKRADRAGVYRMVVTGTNIEESKQAINICQDYPDKLVCTVGIHPHHASDWTPQVATTIQQLSDNDCVRAIGETGLDFNRNFSPRDDQVNAFQCQLEIAASMAKPVFLHQRDAHETFVGVLREYRSSLDKIVVHCFTDNKSALFDYLDLDCHIGITGWICDERRGVELTELVQFIPSDRLMIETDSPYLLPRNLPVKPPSRINEPANLPHILDWIAQCQSKPAEVLAAECLHTSRLFFGI